MGRMRHLEDVALTDYFFFSTLLIDSLIALSMVSGEIENGALSPMFVP